MADSKYGIVVTTINHPTHAVRSIQDNAHRLGADFYVIGDGKSPPDFDLPGSIYMDLAAQVESGFRFARECPKGHYARKNVGYLAAIRDGVDVIVETDDDNIPIDGFWTPRSRRIEAPVVTARGWCNVYRYFSDKPIWPRGLPLRNVQDKVAPRSSLMVQGADCPIQQGLADDNPDVDAIYRLVMPLPISFEGDPVILGDGVWCPFNSQNTTFFKDAFPLLYLPYHCSFRMTDIWRSFIAQRVGWACGWNLLFHGSTVSQERNEHDLMRDFAEEIPGYLHNESIKGVLEDLDLSGKVDRLGDDLLRCYQALIGLGVVGAEEERLVAAWNEDLASL